jgi:carboxylesterase
MPQIIPTAEPFFFPGNKIGCLLIHGFTGAPKEMRWMGEYLAKRGFSALGLRLTGHATRPKDMLRSRYTDWMASVEDGYHLLRGATEQVFLIGLSMGGVLALLMSTHLEVSGVVAMSTPYELPNDPRLKFIKQIAWFTRYMPKSDEPPGTGWFDHEAWKDHVSYPKNPVRSIAELVSLLKEMRAALPGVQVPVLLIHSRDDASVSPENMPQIYYALGTTDKQMLWVEGSGHVIPREPPRQRVFGAAADFIERVVSAV